MQKKNKKYNIGIVLGGGGARGFAHIGVLKALNESGIYPEIISGVSAGAIIGSLYADGYSPDEILALFKQNKLFNYLKLINPKQGLFKMTGLAKVISKNLKAKTFEELKLPLIINATDLNNGKCEYFSSGELFKHILASSTIPGLFPPVVIDDISFVDGGVLNNFPIEPIEKNCNYLIGVNLNPMGFQTDFNNIIHIIERTFHLGIAHEITNKKKKCDLFIEPDGIRKFKIHDVSKITDIYNLGYMEAKRILTENKRKKFLR